jgi:hypothetical protein
VFFQNFSISTSLNDLLMQRSIFYGSLALEHPDFSSSPYSISLLNEGSIEQFLQGDLIYVKLSFVDQLSQKICKSQCLLRLYALSLRGDTPEGMFEPSPSLFRFEDLPCSEENLTLISFQLSYSKSLLDFPKLLGNYSVAVFAEVSSGTETLQSSVLNFTIQLCPYGYVLESDVNVFYRCIPCLAGSFVNLSSTPPVCSKCLSGKFSKRNSFECSDCQRGEFSAEEGQADGCSACSSGTFSERFGQSHCSICDLGFYSEKSGSSYCNQCPGNRITRLTRSASLSDCVCSEGFYGLLNQSLGIGFQQECKPCVSTRGVSCPTNSSIPKVEPGFWRSSWDVNVVHECIPVSSCLRTEFDEITGCAFGYHGVRCGKCIGESFRNVNGCNHCPSPVLNTAIFSLACIFISALFVYLLVRESHGSSLNARQIISALQSFGVLSRLISTGGSSNAGISTISRIFNIFVRFLDFVSQCLIEV